MYISRSFWFSLAVGLLVVLGDSQAQPAPSSAQPSKGPMPAKLIPDKQGTAFLDQAVKKLEPKELGWMETKLWHQVDMHGVTFVAEGKYLAGPQMHFKLTLDLNKERAGPGPKGNVDIICDGDTLWESWQLPMKNWAISVDLKKAQKAMEDMKIPEVLRSEFYQNQSFQGVWPLLKTLQKLLVITRKENVTWQGREVVKLTGGWTEEETGRLGLGGERWVGFLPRECHIYLGRESPYWPYRIEWWGPAPPRSGDALLMQVEFRDPRWNQQLSADQIAKEFKFEKAGKEVLDDTDRRIKKLQDHAEEIKKITEIPTK